MNVSFYECLKRDYIRLNPGRKPSGLKFVEACITHPGFLACYLLRVQQVLHSKGWRRASGFVRVIANSWTGADFVPGCQVGPGLVLHHPTGVVIGRGVIVGSDCTLMQGVTLGERHADGRPPHLYPRLGNGVTVGAGATVLGSIEIGDDARVGANSVVLRDVPIGGLAVGSPATLR